MLNIGNRKKEEEVMYYIVLIKFKLYFMLQEIHQKIQILPGSEHRTQFWGLLNYIYQ